MIKTFLLIVTNLLAFSTFGQNIKLSQTRSADDVEVKNGNYVLYFKKTDLIAAINDIDKLTKTDNSGIVNSIKSNILKKVNLSSVAATDKPIIDLLKSNLGAYLLTKGKSTVFNGSAAIKEISADESPEMVDLDGSSKTTIFFSEVNMDTPVFLGDLNTKLKQSVKQ